MNAPALMVLAMLAAGSCFTAAGQATPPTPFRIAVVDDTTGRGVPLVELRTVHKVAWWTDSNGLVAFSEPGLMDCDVYFHVASPGYEFPADGFGNRGVRLKPVPGGRAEIRLKRLNIAERLYRITGGGIYRDTVLMGGKPPIREPLLNGQVLGQDTVVAVPYRGSIRWFWGDTDRVSYPLGNFAASGAVSEWPGRGGLDPAVGVDLTYFVDGAGFSRAMCPGFGRGLHWIEGVMTVPDEAGAERLVARVSSQEGLMPAYAWHLAVFDDAKGVFEKRITWDLRDGHDSSHPFRARAGGVEYLFVYPNWRVRADLAHLSKPETYEAFTCISKGPAAGADGEVAVDRDAAGRPRYGWRAGMARLHPGRVRELVRRGVMRPDESWLRLRDVATGEGVPDGRGSVFWNAFRARWVMIVSGNAGDVWFAEADTPVGPWVYARRVATHGDYNFYNPTQHPFFDQEGGRLIYFEGTYTDSFSGARAKTPRYDYNQIMYRLALDDPRLRLPVPVYRIRSAVGGGVAQLMTRESVAANRAWDRVEGIEFLAYPPDSRGEGCVGISLDDAGELRRVAEADRSKPAFVVFASPPKEGAGAKTGVDLVALRRLRVPDVSGRRHALGGGDGANGAGDDAPLGWVWATPPGAFPFDSDVEPLPVSAP